MTCSHDFDKAQERVCYAHCFAASDAMLYGDDYSRRRLDEAENDLRATAARCIAEGVTGFIPITKTVPVGLFKNGLIDMRVWDVCGYSEYASDGVPRYVELVERIEPLEEDPGHWLINTAA